MTACVHPGPAGKRSARKAVAVGAVLLTLAAVASRGSATTTAVSDGPPATSMPASRFATVSKLMNDAIAAQRLPGAVVVIGHGGTRVFHQAYGSRKLAGEPGLDGSLAPAEPMTEDTFRHASLTKFSQRRLRSSTLRTRLGSVRRRCAEVSAGLQHGQRSSRVLKVTVRMLLTHTSGEASDVGLKDPWGLDVADKTEGIHRALTRPLQSGPGEVFRYSDINFLLLGALIEAVTGEAEDEYVQQNVFGRLTWQTPALFPRPKHVGPTR